MFATAWLAPSSLIVAALSAVLIWIAVEDLRRFVVRNSAVALLVGCFLAECLRRDDPHFVLSHGILALIALALLFVAFTQRWLGGGDAKLLSAALLWVGPEQSALLAVALFMSTVFYAAGAWCRVLPTRKTNGRTAIPFAPSICLAWIVCIAGAPRPG